jgi:hypothetical protein
MSKRNIPIDKKKVLIELGFVPIPEYDGYWAREDGKIGSSNNRETGSVKILSPLVINSGYQTVTLIKAGVYNERRTVHRLIAFTFLPNPRNLPEVNHKNGNKLDNRLDNLEWISTVGNRVHAIETGLRIPLKGEQAGRSKLTESQVMEIHKLYSEGISTIEIAVKYGISNKHVDTISKGVEWKHLGLERLCRGKASGERQHRSVLIARQVLEIRALHESGVSALKISKLYPCGVSAVRHIITRRSWMHI